MSEVSLKHTYLNKIRGVYDMTTKYDRAAWRVKSMSHNTPWGNEKKWSALPGVNGKLLTIKEGHRTSLKFHKTKSEAFYILKGKVKFSFADEEWLHYKGIEMKTETLTEGDSMCVQSHCVYRIEALEESQVIELGGYGHDHDIVRIQDDYGRSTTDSEYPNL